MVLFTEKGGFLLAAFTHAVSSGTATPLTRIDRSVFAEFASFRKSALTLLQLKKYNVQKSKHLHCRIFIIVIILDMTG